MYLLFNDLIYSLIYEERVTVPTKFTAPLSITFYSASKATKVFTGTCKKITKVIHMFELPKHFSDIFYPSCLYNRFLDLLKRIRAQPTRFVQVCAPNARGLASDAT